MRQDCPASRLAGQLSSNEGDVLAGANELTIRRPVQRKG